MGFKSFINRFFRPTAALGKNIEQMFGISVNDIAPYEEAMRHCSVSEGTNNERLEYLGDAVLDLIVADLLYREYPDLNEGQLTKVKSRIVSRENFRRLAIEMGMHEKLPIHKQKDLDSKKIIGNVLEAVYGAIYLDQGYRITRDRALIMIEKYCSMEEMISNMADPKSSLLEWAQKHKRKLKFQMSDISNLQEPRFRARVILDGEHLVSAEGKSKKKAQMKAAREALASLGLSTD